MHLLPINYDIGCRLWLRVYLQLKLLRERIVIEESQPGPAPRKKREVQQEISTLMAADEEEQTEGSILEINLQNVQSPCWLFRHRTNTALPLTGGSLCALVNVLF